MDDVAGTRSAAAGDPGLDGVQQHQQQSSVEFRPSVERELVDEQDQEDLQDQETAIRQAQHTFS